MSTNTGRIELIDINSSVLPFALETLFLGANIVLMPISTYVLWYKGLKSRANALMLLATLIMFSVAVTHWGLTLIFFTHTMLDSIRSCGPDTGAVSDFVAREWLPLINILLTDAIVLWRTWVVLGYRSKHSLALGYSVILACIVITLALKFTNYAMFACTIAINLCSTLIMSYKTWTHRRLMKRNDLLSLNAAAVQTVLVLLVGSGALYCMLWILTLAFLLSGLQDGFLIMAAILVPISGIYPTLIIVLVCLQKAHHDTLNLTLDRDPSSSTSAPSASALARHSSSDYELRSTNDSLPTIPRPTVRRTSTSTSRRHSIPLYFDLRSIKRSENPSWADVTSS